MHTVQSTLGILQGYVDKFPGHRKSYIEHCLTTPPTETIAGLTHLLKHPGEVVPLVESMQGDLAVLTGQKSYVTGKRYDAAVPQSEMPEAKNPEEFVCASINAGSLTKGLYEALEVKEAVQGERAENLWKLVNWLSGKEGQALDIICFQDLPFDESLFALFATMGYEVIAQKYMDHPNSPYPSAAMATLINRRRVSHPIKSLSTMPHYQHDADGRTNGPVDWQMAKGKHNPKAEPYNAFFAGQTLILELDAEGRSVKVGNGYMSYVSGLPQRRVNILRSMQAIDSISPECDSLSVFCGDMNMFGPDVDFTTDIWGVIPSHPLLFTLSLPSHVVFKENYHNLREVARHGKAALRLGKPWIFRNLVDPKSVRNTLLVDVPVIGKVLGLLGRKKVGYVLDAVFTPIGQPSTVEVRENDFTDHDTVVFSLLAGKRVAKKEAYDAYDKIDRNSVFGDMLSYWLIGSFCYAALHFLGNRLKFPKIRRSN